MTARPARVALLLAAVAAWPTPPALRAAIPAPVPAAADQPAPDDLLTRAIAAAGGEDRLAAAHAFEWNATALIHTSEGPITIAGVWRIEPPDRAEVATFETERGPEATRRLIIGGSRGLIERDGQRSPMPDGMLAEERHQFYLYWLLQLLPLRDPDTTLVFSREDAAGRTAVRVSRPGRPDVTMLFDKQARVIGLSTVFATSGDPRPRQEVVLSGTIEASGVRWFRRMAITRDGKPYYEMALTSLKTIPGLPDAWPVMPGR